MTPEKFKKQCDDIVANHHGDAAHAKLDELVTELLTGLGYGDGMKVFLSAVRPCHNTEPPADVVGECPACASNLFVIWRAGVCFVGCEDEDECGYEGPAAWDESSAISHHKGVCLVGCEAVEAHQQSKTAPADVVEAAANILRGYGVCVDVNRVAGEILALSAQPAPSQSGLVEVHKELDEGSGFWHICSGCSGTDNPYSAVYRCDVGMGCNECGGIGVCWDDTDYQAFASTDHTNNQPAPDDGLVKRIKYILDPEATAQERIQRRSHLTNHDLRTILSALTAKDHTALRDALGAHIQADACADTMPDDDEDAAYLQKQETHWRLTAQGWLSRRQSGDCAEAAKKRALKENPIRIDQALATKGDGE